MSTATRVPETHELEGEDALNALHRTGWGRLAKDSLQRFRTGWGRLAKDSLQRFRTADGFSQRPTPPRSGWIRLSRPGVGGRC
jgi:hypothetical protein